MKTMNWPEQGLPAGMTQKQFEVRYTEYPFNPITHGGHVSEFADSEGFIEVAEAPNGFMVRQAPGLPRHDAALSRTQLCAGRPANNPLAPCIVCFSTAWSIRIRRSLFSEDFAFCRRWRDMGKFIL